MMIPNHQLAFWIYILPLLLVELRLPVCHLACLVSPFQRVGKLLASSLHGVGLTAVAHLAVELSQQVERMLMHFIVISLQ